ncbi:Choline-sulfatase [Planctomycetales bacterium 10988]|nr:Choline-sulfatase [Planctomycetales bacterium 10988]
MIFNLRNLGAVCALLLSVTMLTANEKPNLVFIIADDCTFHDIGCYGGQAHTPNIDKLATEGMQMMQCFQAAPMCSPTRHNLYTGIYPVKSGAYPNHTFVKDGVQSVVHYLEPLGYRVALSGKTHIAPKEAFPFEYSAKDNNPDMQAINRLMKESTESDQPFCLFACSNEPHSPWNKGDASRYPPESLNLPPYWVNAPDLRKKYSRYLAEITYYDGQVGEILAMLDQHGITENTLVMVVSEQGNGFPFAKWTCYDAGLQSAMIVRWPGKIAKGSTSRALVEYVDVLPTFVEIAGGTPAEVLEGKSMLPVLLGETDHHKEYVYGIQTTRGIYAGPDHYGRRSVRSDSFKLIHNLSPDARFFNGIAKAPYFKNWEKKAAEGNKRAKAFVERYYQPPEYELFDVKNDPWQLKNLADDPHYAEVLAELQTQLAAWMQSQGDHGHATEMQAFDHMLTGNADAKAAIEKRKNKQPGKRKKPTSQE